MRSPCALMKGIVLALMLALVALSAASAQLWRGSSSLGVAIKDSKGGPIAGARMTVAYRDVGFGDGPAPRLTDARGEANFTGIAPGTWSLKIDHPDYLSYMATVVVRGGKKPQILTEFLEATGSGRQTMRVKPLKGVSDERGAPVEPTAMASAPAPRQAPAEAPSSPVADSAAPPVQDSPSVAATEPVVAAAEESAGTAVEIDLPAQTATEPPQAPPGASPSAPVAVPPPPRSVQSTAARPPLESPASTPTTGPQAPSEPLFPDHRALRSYRDRTCFECKPGEWGVAASVAAEAATDTSCQPPPTERLRDLMNDLLTSHGERLVSYGGPLPLNAADLPPGLRQLLTGSCRLAAVVLPAGARFTGFRFQAADEGDLGDCLGDKECGVGQARWLFNPGIARSSQATIVFSVFRNESASRARTAILTAYFVPPGSWIAGR